MITKQYIKSIVKKLHYKACDQAYENGFQNFMQAVETHTASAAAQALPSLWRKIMKSSITKFAAAAVFLAVAVLAFLFPEFTGTPAYALEQTIEANQNVKFVHFYFVPVDDDLKKEAWIQYDEFGQLKKLRVDTYNTGGPGTKWIYVWSAGKTVIWYVDENIANYRDFNSIQNEIMLRFAQKNSPRDAVEFLYKMEQEGKIQVSIDQNSANEIRVTGHYPKGAYLTANPEYPPSADVLVINPDNKLVTRIEVYKDQKFIGAWDKYDYRPFDLGIFDIEKLMPAEVVREVEYNVSDPNSVGVAKWGVKC